MIQNSENDSPSFETSPFCKTKIIQQFEDLGSKQFIFKYHWKRNVKVDLGYKIRSLLSLSGGSGSPHFTPLLLVL